MTQDDRDFIVSVIAAQIAITRHGCDGAAAMMGAYKRAIAEFANVVPGTKPAEPKTVRTADGREFLVRHPRARQIVDSLT